MGMFDYIYSDYPLPPVIIDGKKVVFDSTEDFQTKDLENALCEFRISKDGKLMTPMLKEYDPKNNWMFRGIIDFYTTKKINGNTYWIEYHAVFKDGVLKEITPLVEKIKPNSI